jgi:hypothetical protein
MATYTNLINFVLRKMRESEVAGPTSTTYATLVGDFVNEAKREVEDAWKWNVLRTTTSVTTAAGTQQYALTGAGKRFKLQHPNYSVYDATNLGRIYQKDAQWMKEALLNNTTQNEPSYFYFSGFDSNEDPYVTFYPIPDGIYTINFELVVPQSDFSTGSETLSVPDWPVKLGAWAKALEERGDDNGNQVLKVQSDYQLALSDAIAMDAALFPGETDWYI